MTYPSLCPSLCLALAFALAAFALASPVFCDFLHQGIPLKCGRLINTIEVTIYPKFVLHNSQLFKTTSLYGPVTMWGVKYMTAQAVCITNRGLWYTSYTNQSQKI